VLSLKYSGVMVLGIAKHLSSTSLAKLIQDFETRPHESYLSAKPRFSLAKPLRKPLVFRRELIEFLMPHLRRLLADGEVRIGRPHSRL